ncbi:TerD family protein [Catelliglobosispora koreensis]|uniref:TerD family protein n=1 Tax=Catelliglobosispora koreensis TaxID=129052 RepID=UPI00036E9BF8|nr:TerD family protein [Catelliglobosispora koreensis]
MPTDRNGDSTRQGKTTAGSRRPGPPTSRVPAEPAYHVHSPGGIDETGINVAFRADEPGLTSKVEARLTYDAHKSPDDLLFHLAAFMVDENGTVPRHDPYYSVHHAWIRSKDLSLFRQGRRPHGSGSLDETIIADLPLVVDEIAKVVFVAYIQTGAVEHKFADVVDGLVTFSEVLPDGSTREFARHELDADYGDGHRAVIVGKLIRRAHPAGADEWIFVESGEGITSLIEAGDLFGVKFV